jgi:hypothetical protein
LWVKGSAPDQAHHCNLQVDVGVTQKI